MNVSPCIMQCILVSWFVAVVLYMRLLLETLDRIGLAPF